MCKFCEEEPTVTHCENPHCFICKDGDSVDYDLEETRPMTNHSWNDDGELE